MVIKSRTIDLNSPPSRSKAVLWHVAGGWLGNFLIIVQGLLLIPLYIGFLGDRLYGFWLASSGVLAWMTMVDVGGASITKVRCASAYAKKDLGLVAAYFWHGVIIMCLVVSTFLVLVFSLGSHVVEWLNVDEEYTDIIFQCFLIVGLGTSLSLWNNFLRDFASALQRNKVPVFLQTLGDLVALIGILVALLILDLGLWSLVIGVLIRTTIPFLGNLFHTFLILRSAGSRIRWARLIFKDYLTTMPSVLGAKASGNFTRQLPVVILGKFYGPEVTVAYTVTMRLLQMGQHFINHGLSALNAACSHFYGDPSVSPERKSKLVGSLTRGYTFLAGASVLGYALLNHGFVTLWTGQEHFLGQDFTVLAAIGSFLLLRSSILTSQISALGLIRQACNASIIEQLLKGILIILGTYAIGVEGIPLAIISSGLCTQFLYFRILNQADLGVMEGLKPLFWTWVPVAALVGMTNIVSSVFVMGNWALFLLYAAITGAALGLVVVFGVPQFQDLIKNFIVSALKLFGLRFLTMRP